MLLLDSSIKNKCSRWKSGRFCRKGEIFELMERLRLLSSIQTRRCHFHARASPVTALYYNFIIKTKIIDHFASQRLQALREEKLYDCVQVKIKLLYT
jgi:hypothetical protein